MSERYLKCHVFKGMFSDELAVKVNSKQGGEPSFFVPKELVKGEVDREGSVRVRVFHKGQTAWAVIPDEQQTAVPVDEAELILI